MASKKNLSRVRCLGIGTTLVLFYVWVGDWDNTCVILCLGWGLGQHLCYFIMIAPSLALAANAINPLATVPPAVKVICTVAMLVSARAQLIA
jgi:hypothetical protein